MLPDSPEPKRRYTVTTKVLAANRRNLQKANAVPKEIRYRPTPKRQAACRQNLLKAAAQRPPARPSRGPWACCSLRRTLQRCGEKLQAYWGHLEQVARIVAPEDRDRVQGKLALGMGDALWRWLRLLRSEVQREREGLLSLCQHQPDAADPLAAAGWACRLLRVFRQGDWLPAAFDRLGGRLQRLGRLFWEQRHIPRRRLRTALDEAPAAALGNPFRPLPPGGAAAVFRAPLPAVQFVDSERRLPALAGEAPLPEEEAGLLEEELAEEQEEEGEEEEKEQDKDQEEKEGKGNSGGELDWPDGFEGYHELVQATLEAPSELAALVERIARLSWQRQQVWERELGRAEAELESTLARCPTPMSADRFVSEALEALAGKDEALAEAAELESELAAALEEYLRRRYGPHPAFDLLREPAAGENSAPCPPQAETGSSVEAPVEEAPEASEAGLDSAWAAVPEPEGG